MTDVDIKKLLDGFYNGSLGEEEEGELKDALLTDSCQVAYRQASSSQQANWQSESYPTDDLTTERALFRSLFAEKAEVDVPDGMEERLSRLIDERAAAERHFLHPDKIRRNWRWIGGIAATVLLTIGMGFGAIFPKTDIPKDTFTDPQEAYRVLQATLMEVSDCMHEGIAQVQETQMDIKAMSQEIYNEIQN